MKTKKIYLAGLTERGDDEWVWQGFVVAISMAEAKSLLVALIKKAGLKLTTVVDVGPTGEAEDIGNQKVKSGIYNSTSYDELEANAAFCFTPTHSKSFKVAVEEFWDISPW